MTNNRARKTAANAEIAYETLVAEEALILQGQMVIQRAINDRGMSQKELADILDVAPSYVSQMLGDSARNLTLRTIARVLFALGCEAEIRLEGQQVDAAEGDPASHAADCTARANDLASCLDSDAWGEVISLETRRPRRGRKNARANGTQAVPDYAIAA